MLLYILLLFNLILFYQTTKAEASDLEAQAIGKQVLALAFFPDDIGRKLFVRNTSNNPTSETRIRTSAEEDVVLFKTEKIYNDKCIHKSDAWSFETDPKGEDMYSRTYGGSWSEEITTSIRNIIKGRTPIANEKMLIKFTITNNSSKSLYFDEFLIRITDTFYAKVEHTFYDVYKIRASKELYTIQFNGTRVYGGETEQEEIKPGKKLLCKMEVVGDESRNGLIHQFEIKVSLSGGDKDYIKISDKKYLIGFVNLDSVQKW